MIFLMVMVVCVSIVACDKMGWKSDFMNSDFAAGVFRSPATENSIVGVCQSDDENLKMPVDINQKLSYQQVSDITRLAVERAGGLDQVVDYGDWVLIKVNIAFHQTPYTIKGSASDLRIAKSLVEQLIEQGRAERITIGEGCASHPGKLPFMVHYPHYDNLSYDDLVKELDETTDIQVDWINFNRESEKSPFKRDIPIPGGGLEKDKYTLPSAIVDCDKFIVLSSMKTHFITNTTMTHKNYIGIAPSAIYGIPGGITHILEPHVAPPFRGLFKNYMHTTDRTVADLFSLRPADFGIVGCFLGMEGNGPVFGKTIKRNIVFAGSDPLALDAAGSYYMGMNPWDQDYLHWSFQKGHGNTFGLEKIIINGPDNTSGKAKPMIDKILSDYNLAAFKKPTMVPFQGRANRIWLLNGPHKGNDIQKDYLGGAEIDIEPIENEITSGKPWELFFDYSDYMDLANYYKGVSNCVSYAYTNIISKESMPAEFWFSGDNGMKIFLNGEVVFEETDTSVNRKLPGNPFARNKIKVNLNEGKNKLLVKVQNKAYAYGFSLYVCEPDGDTPLGIRYELPGKEDLL